MTAPWWGSRPGWGLHNYTVFIYLFSLGLRVSQPHLSALSPVLQRRQLCPSFSGSPLQRAPS